MHKSVQSFLLLLRVLLIVLGGVVLIFTPFMGQVWKESSVRGKSLQRERLIEEFAVLQGKTGTLQLLVRNLSKTDRLEQYACDSLGMIPPDPAAILMIDRKRNGELLVRESDMQRLLKQLMGVRNERL